MLQKIFYSVSLIVKTSSIKVICTCREKNDFFKIYRGSCQIDVLYILWFCFLKEFFSLFLHLTKEKIKKRVRNDSSGMILTRRMSLGFLLCLLSSSSPCPQPPPISGWELPPPWFSEALDRQQWSRSPQICLQIAPCLLLTPRKITELLQVTVSLTWETTHPVVYGSRQNA